MSRPAHPAVPPDAYAAARAEHPQAALLRLVDEAAGVEITLAVPPESAWHALLPPEQTATIRRA